MIITPEENVFPVEDKKRKSLSLHLSPQTNNRLRHLAMQSRMTNEDYVSSILEDAIESGEMIKFIQNHMEAEPALTN